MTRGRGEVQPSVVGPSNIPQRSPCTSRRSSSATSRPSSSSSLRPVRSEGGGLGRRGRAGPPPRVGTIGTWPRSAATWPVLPPTRRVPGAPGRGHRRRPTTPAIPSADGPVRPPRPRALRTLVRVQGFSLMAPPGRRATGRTPQAAARSPYSPLGSTTQARRPKTAWRQRNVLTKALLPRPICPNTTMLGLEITPWA